MSQHVRALAAAAAIVATLGLAACGQDREDTTEQAANDREAMLERGRYLVAIMDCTGCHTPGGLAGAPRMERALAGGDVGFELPGLGVVYPPNLTQHPSADISKWSEAEIVKVLRTGERPDGRVLAPVMPWKAYAHLTDEDAAALAAYLKTLPGIDSPRIPQGAAETATAPFLRLTMPAGAARPSGAAPGAAPAIPPTPPAGAPPAPGGAPTPAGTDRG